MPEALLGVKWTVCEADHSPPCGVDVEAAPPLMSSAQGA